VLSISYRAGRQIQTKHKSCKLTYILIIWIVIGARKRKKEKKNSDTSGNSTLAADITKLAQLLRVDLDNVNIICTYEAMVI